jgi:hypothetical protein
MSRIRQHVPSGKTSALPPPHSRSAMHTATDQTKTHGDEATNDWHRLASRTSLGCPTLTCSTCRTQICVGAALCLAAPPPPPSPPSASPVPCPCRSSTGPSVHQQQQVTLPTLLHPSY